MRLRKTRHLGRFVLKNIRCFASTGIPLDPKITVIIGGNGAGKTTLVEALASLAGPPEGLPVFPLRKGENSGEILLYEAGHAEPVSYWKQDGNGEQRLNLEDDRWLFAYGRYRRVFDPNEQQPAEGRAMDPVLLLESLAAHAHRDRTSTLNHPDNHLLADLSRYLVALNTGRESDKRLQKVWEHLNTSLPKMEASLSEIQMRTERSEYIPLIVRNGVPLEIGQLSDGYQALLVVIFDLILRYPYLFTQLENPLEGGGIVAIDEVDLHLHPRWQRNVISQLGQLFPNTQFILTTHSPMVVQGAIDAGMTVVTLHENKGSVVARKLPPGVMSEMKGAEVGSVLFEDHLFGLNSRYSPEVEAQEKRAEELQKKVSSGSATGADVSELSQHLSNMEKLVAKEDLRRADGSSVSQMVRLQNAFVQDLIRELKKVKSE